MNKEGKKNLRILARYIILLAVAVLGVSLFHFIFLPLTKYPVFYFLDIFFDALLVGNAIFINNVTIEIAGACVAGSAYFLLLILNLGTPNINPDKRIKMILYGFGIFLVVNIIRIIFLSFLFLNSSPYFDFLHKFLWYFGSTVLVVGIWFFEVKIFRLKDIPFYSDLRYLYRKSSFPSLTKKRR